MKIIFEVHGTITQNIVSTNPEYSEERIKNLLESGQALTSIGYGESSGFVYLNDIAIGKVVSQSANDDLEIYTYQVEDMFDAWKEALRYND